jgi:hypothetical protein
MASTPDSLAESTPPEIKSTAPRLELPPPTFPENVDPEIFAAWKEHMIQGYHHNTQMFNRTSC